MSDGEFTDGKHKQQKNKILARDELLKLSQEELILKIIQLQAHNIQLKNLIAKKNGESENAKTPKAKEKVFNFDEFPKLHIFLRLLYLGWDYQGYAIQEDSSQTIENHLFNALLRCRLIQSRETSNYHRCGRTDKGVSSFGQVISITVRASKTENPLNYCQMLNRLLPAEIRAVAWRPVEIDLSARFNCLSRTYLYFFPKTNLNIETIREAASYLIGSHDFRNLCKMDVGNGVTNFMRTVDKVSIEPFDNSTVENDPYAIYLFKLTGKAFLWHQVRCIVSILLLVGQDLETPDIVKRLLDVENQPRKPQYTIASPVPLNLFNCGYESNEWLTEQDETRLLIEHLQTMWAEQQIKAVQIRCMIKEIEKLSKTPVFGQCSGLVRKESKVYKPLFHRQLCNSLEERIEHYSKKQRLK